MSRLFVTPRELDFFNDISREVIKDIMGQKIYYYSISYHKTLVHDVYQEAPEKIFEQAIEIPAMVKWYPTDPVTNEFGLDEAYKIEVFLHIRDLINKKINVSEGDFFSYGSNFFEVATSIVNDNVYGEIEYSMGQRIFGIPARMNNFVTKILGPTWEGFTGDINAVQETFIQQRGFEENAEGPTGDQRDLIKKGALDEPITGPKEVSPKGSDLKSDSSFYDDGDC